ncbi:ISL3 family transposase [Clostridiaceae bacterium HFYG-1003]|nr:ISL3 family transposase [Clostridiaceae bacterium HFYG-1003]UUM11071.1 ISL3 family transposase [Clostridiaceae bacterium HFYG-1003]UUM11619.1 ISL3 family transposase [Clostridiaceae bacterium HFYG-1003]
MNYTQDEQANTITDYQNYLHIPSSLIGFTNTHSSQHTAVSGKSVIQFHGVLKLDDTDRACPNCGGFMHINNTSSCSLWHLNFGHTYTSLEFDKNQLLCPTCGITRVQQVPFQAQGHRISQPLLQYTRDLLAIGTYNLKQVAEITGLGKNTVKAIDLKRLEEMYTLDGKLTKPQRQAKYLSIDEFKLHRGHQYATHIIDIETGHILWIAHGKRKQVVYDFIEHVGLEWMDGVEAVASDMNSDFQEAFEEKCPHIQPVFDHFHIVKNFNDKVVAEVRKDEQRRLQAEGDYKAAESLKRTRYILMSSRETLQRKDLEAVQGKPLSKGGTLFPKAMITRCPGSEEKYDQLIQDNQLLLTLDLIKVMLSEAYKAASEPEMAVLITEIMEVCYASRNDHLRWFGRLMDRHFEGIIAFATYRISNGQIEGINNKIKTLRRQGYGYPDDEYFFLKLFDMSRKTYVRNPPSHRIYD